MLSRLVWTAVAAAVCASARGKLTFGLTEIDLVFPQNETFAPTSKLPVVFAVQNPNVARHVLVELNYTISTLDTPYHDVRDLTSTVKLDWKDGNQTQYLVADFDGPASKEGQYIMRYNLFLGDFMGTDGLDYNRIPNMVNGFDLNRRGDLINEANVTFTIAKDAQGVNLGALMGDKGCKSAQAAAFDVVRPDEVDEPDMISLAWPAPTPRPCRVDLGEDEASSISSELGMVTGKPETKDNTKDDKSNKNAASRTSASAMLFSTGIAWLVYALY